MNKHLHTISNRSKNLTRLLRSGVVLLATLFTLYGYSQVLGEYRTAGSGNWSATSTWQYYNGTNWVAATTYPGQNANTPKVTINTGHTVVLDVDITAFTITQLDILGSGRLGLLGNITRQLNAQQVYIVPNGVYPGPNILYGSSQAALRLPNNSFIAYPPNYKALPETNVDPNTSCNNQTAIYIGGGEFGDPEVKYAACNGGGNVCVIFNEVNQGGGTIRVIPELDLSTTAGFQNISCTNNFVGKVNIFGLFTGSLISLNLGPNTNVTFSPSSFTNLVDGGAGDEDGMVDGKIVKTVTISTPSLVGQADPVTYQATASAVLTVTATGCTNFAAATSVTRDFIVRPPVSVSSSAPSTVCQGDDASVMVTNNTNLATQVFYTHNNVQSNVLLTAMQSINIPVNTASPGTVTYIIDSARFTTSPACKVVINNTINVSVTTLTGLAIDGDSKTNQAIQPPASGIVNSAVGCRLIAQVVPPASTGVPFVDGKAYVQAGAAPVYFQGIPYVGRRISLTPKPFDFLNDEATITLFYTQAEFDGFNSVPNAFDLPKGPTDPDNDKPNLRIYKFSTGAYDPMTGLPTVTSIADAISDGKLEVIDPSDMNITWTTDYGGAWAVSFFVNDFSLFMCSNDQPVVLPLNLLSFDAKLSGKRNADLIWKTTEERDVQGFEVQVSRDGSQYTSVGLVNARNTLAGGEYNFTTAMPGKLAYFRLKMIDKNGSFTYSPVKVLRTEDLIINSYPNPVKNQLTVDLSGYPAGTMRIVDMSGRIMFSGRTVEGINRVNTSALGNGVYVLEVNVGLESEKIKIAKFER